MWLATWALAQGEQLELASGSHEADVSEAETAMRASRTGAGLCRGAKLGAKRGEGVWFAPFFTPLLPTKTASGPSNLNVFEGPYKCTFFSGPSNLTKIHVPSAASVKNCFAPVPGGGGLPVPSAPASDFPPAFGPEAWPRKNSLGSRSPQRRGARPLTRFFFGWEIRLPY